MAPPLTISIQTFSDTVCPWSYIGKKNLDNAIEAYKEQHPDVEFSVTWNPFYLHPNAKISAYNKKKYYASRFGPSGAAAICERVNNSAAALGLSINWDGICGNTRDSHVLLLLAQKLQQQQDEEGEEEEGGDSTAAHKARDNLLRDTQDTLFYGAFDRGQDISNRGFLVKVALEAGLCESEEELLAHLDNKEARDEADGLDSYAKEVVGITAVPSYVVQGRYRIGGQQSSDVFLQLFDRIRATEVGE
ncbi:dsba oxidoreductase [Diaporthe amygdali]|uniref:dsba oxidoreductase n=1 Tax=Phomopsis amygdali TaxID=1214568 RepID=UPI0022FE41B3|nr:dsba oxidoreductase [Diaporthe amygdali]KAJ0109882.1 dsba oxidoreductase [Diaporthe amygdali]